MSNPTPAVKRPRAQAWDQVLLRIVQVQGRDILAQIVRDKASGEKPPAKPRVTPSELVEQLGSLVQQARKGGAKDLSQVLLGKASQSAKGILVRSHQRWNALRRGVNQLRHGPNRREPLDQAVLEVLSTVGFVGGVLFGLQLPQLDFKLSARGKERDSVIFHAAALLTTEIAAEWIEEIVRRTLLTPNLSQGEIRFLRAVSKVLQSCMRGVEQGWSARQIVAVWIRFWRSPIAKQHLIATDAKAIAFAQQMIERLRNSPK